MPTLGDIFGVEFGISDHTIGSAVPIAAVAMGASIIEKHFILDPVGGGGDADFSMSSVEFKDMVTSIRLVERALGKKDFSLTEASKKARLRSRSIYFCESVSAGDTLTRNNMRVVRGGAGVHSKYFNQLLGCKVKSDTKMGDPLILSNVFDVPDFCK